ncbi:class I SAM-dependent methyltransferase [bacterium]|nr:class I SAM-dependent methyltransferase [bacterium]MBU1917926.1 class I SAM-dependent methyltransferase [bacterium]
MTDLSILRDLCLLNGIDLKGGHAGLYTSFFQTTLKWGCSINITKNISPKRYFIENVLDPVLAHQSLVRALGKIVFPIIDVGCGGGFAGITFHIANEQASSLMLVDSSRKRISFCKDVIRKLCLCKTTAINNSFENTIECFPDNSYLLSRATFSLANFLKTSLKHKTSAPLKIVSFETQQSLVGYFGIDKMVAATATQDNGSFNISKHDGKNYLICKYTIQPDNINRFLVIVDL